MFIENGSVDSADGRTHYGYRVLLEDAVVSFCFVLVGIAALLIRAAAGDVFFMKAFYYS
jgi:hypothetical protein